jgi:PAS domain S-box-containing protein
MMQDMTLIKDTERKLRESKAIMSRIFDDNVDPMSIVDAATLTFIDVNDAYLRFKKLRNKDEVIGRLSLETVTEPALRDRLVDQLQAGNNIRDQEVTLLDGDGNSISTLCSVSAMDLGGRACFVSSIRDITRLKATEDRLRAEVASREQTELKLRESEADLRKIIETSPDGIMIARVSYSTYTAVNESFLKQFGFAREEVIGRSPRELGIWADQA